MVTKLRLDRHVSGRRRGSSDTSETSSTNRLALFVLALFFIVECSRFGLLFRQTVDSNYFATSNSELLSMPLLSSSTPKDDDKANRLMKYFKSYRYVQAASRYDYINFPAKECGSGPEFEAFFKQPQNVRSRYQEDSLIYNHFFKGSGITGPIHGSVVELGAFDGSTESNSHFFEKCLGWKSLLIEGNPENYQKVLANRPLAHKMSFAPSCDAEYERVNKTVPFYRFPMTNVGLPGFAKTYETKPTVDVPCGPLSPVLEDIFEGRTIQFFSLDVEGAERLVLETVDFQKVRVNVWMVEVENQHCRERQDCLVRNQVRELMAQEGYKRYSKLIKASDVFVHPLSPYQIPESVAKPE